MKKMILSRFAYPERLIRFNRDGSIEWAMWDLWKDRQSYVRHLTFGRAVNEDVIMMKCDHEWERFTDQRLGFVATRRQGIILKVRSTITVSNYIRFGIVSASFHSTYNKKTDLFNKAQCSI